MEEIKVDCPYTQDNDPRTNAEKPLTTWQQYVCDDKLLTVHVSDDPNSSIYFQGAPEDYKGGAVQNRDIITE